MSGSARRSVAVKGQDGKNGLVPPDGGWGWVVAGAFALNNACVLPLISGMGLVFKDTFDDLQVSTTSGSIVITLNHGLGMLLSFFGGPVLSRFGYRRVAIFGALCVFSGVTLISLSTGFVSLLIAYSIITSIGVAAVMASFTLAINSFFKEKRSKAIGLAMSITGLGPILMPHLMNLLLTEYGWRYAALTLAGLCLHSLVASLLLRPVKWYMKKPAPPPDEEMQPLTNETIQSTNEEKQEEPKVFNGGAILPAADSLESFQEKDEDYLETPKGIHLSMRSLDSGHGVQSRSIISPDMAIPKSYDKAPIYQLWESQENNMGSSVNVNENGVDAKEIPPKEKEPKKSLLKRWAHNVVVFFDLGLLRDLIFVNIVLGLSIAACAEIYFSLFTPFILDDMRFNTNQIAVLMSIVAFTDMLFRSLSPFIADLCRAKPRVMYLTSLGLVIVTRTVMLYATAYSFMICVAVAIGATKGIRTVYMNVVIPSYVPIERLPFASGIQMLVNGVILICFGPLLGHIKDISGSFKLPITLLNLVTLLTMIMWTTEFLYLRCKGKKEPDQPDTI